MNLSRRDPGQRCRRQRELHPQLGEGHGRCLQRRHQVLHLGRPTTRSSRPGRRRSRTCSRPRPTRRPDLQAHFRYPENLFQVQASQFANVPRDRPRGLLPEAGRLADPDRPHGRRERPAAGGPPPRRPDVMRPYYSLMRLPGATDEHFMLILPFTPLGRQNMVSWMAADSDPGHVREHRRVHVPERSQRRRSDAGVRADQPGPRVLGAIGRCSARGARPCVFGDFLVIPINDSLLYVQPVYVRSTQASSIPELKRVIVVNGDKVGIGNEPVRGAGRLDHRVRPAAGRRRAAAGRPRGTIDQQIRTCSTRRCSTSRPPTRR